MVLNTHVGWCLRAGTTRLVLMGLSGLLGLCLNSGARADALACTLMAEPAGTKAVASRDGQRVPLPANLPDCAGVQVTEGAVVACIATPLDALKCARLSKGDKLDPAVFGPKTATQGWRKSLQALLNGGAGAVVAQSRGAAGDLPTGQVLMAALRFDIDFTRDALAGVEAIEFREGNPGGPLVVRVPGIGVRTVDTARFVPGKTYSWSMVFPGNLSFLHGQFVVLDQTARREARKAVEQALNAHKAFQAHPDPMVIAIVSADSLYEQGYAFDAAQVLRQGLPVP